MLSCVYRTTIALLLSYILLIAPTAAQEPYRLQPGDVIAFSVLALPNLNRMMRVSPDGEINVPLVGRVPAADRTLAEIEARIREALVDAVYRPRVDGDELLIVVRPDEVSLEVAEFRPIHVMGEVARPGEQAFRAGLTVRRAISVAGGLLTTRPVPTADLITQEANLTADYQSVLAQYIAAAANLSRLQAELAGSTTIADDAALSSDMPEGSVMQVRQTAQEQLDAQIAFAGSEKAYIQNAIQQNGQRIAVLREQQRQEQEGVDADTAEFARIQQLASQQAVQATRVTEARRQLLLSSTRALSTKVELSAVEIRQADLIRSLERFDEQRRIAVLGELRDATQNIAGIRARLQALLTRLSLPATTDVQPPLRIMIYRRDGGRERGFTADLDAVVQPGDAIEISYGQDAAPG